MALYVATNVNLPRTSRGHPSRRVHAKQATRTTLDAHLALTPEAFWIIHLEEIKRWSIVSFAKLSRRGRKLLLVCQASDEARRYRLKFSQTKDCQDWYKLLGTMMQSPSRHPREESSKPSQEPVVLLGRGPNVGYQLLGTVEAKGEKRRHIQDVLRLRGAMMGADAVVDIQEE